MFTKTYKEGQGKWSRTILVMVIVIAALAALAQLHEALPRGSDLRILGFNLDWRFLVHLPIFLGALYLASWLFNRPRTADFLIDTESELKNKVTWPSQKEEVSSSVVVVVAVLFFGAFIFFWDLVFKLVFVDGWYELGS